MQLIYYLQNKYLVKAENGPEVVMTSDFDNELDTNTRRALGYTHSVKGGDNPL